MTMTPHDDTSNSDLLCSKKRNEITLFYFKRAIKRYGKKGKRNESNFFVLNQRKVNTKSRLGASGSRDPRVPRMCPITVAQVSDGCGANREERERGCGPR